MESVRKLGEKTLYIRGSPSTLIYLDEKAYVVDPGLGGKRAKKIRSVIRKLNRNYTICILTHYHADHIAISEKIGAKEIWASEKDAPYVEDSVLRNYMTYGYTFKSADYILYNAPDIRVDCRLKVPYKVNGLDIIPLPGHTLGHVGVLTDDSVAYLADSFFGEKVLSNVGIPYYFNPFLALQTLDYIEENVAIDYETVIISHGPVLSRDKCKEIISKNRERIVKIVSMVLEELSKYPKNTMELALKILSRLNIKANHTLLMLSNVFLKSLLSTLEEKGEVKLLVSERGLVWKKT